MELLDLIGDAICHRDPHRTIDGAWVCLRCTALYSAGLVGIVWAGAFRKVELWGQLLAATLLLLPVVLDGAFVPWGSPLDQPWLRITNGALAGLGSGLFMGARAAAVVRWPQWLMPLRLGAPIGGTVAVVAGVVLACMSNTLLLDAVTVAGLVLLCASGSGWAWATLGWLVARRRELVWDRFQRLGLGVMAVLVPLELAIVSVAPDTWKPGMGWVRVILHTLGLCVLLLVLLPADRAGAHLPHDTVAEVAVEGHGSTAHIVAQYLYPARRMFVISEDGGRTWAFRADADSEGVLDDLEFASGTMLFGADGVERAGLRSGDGGYSWERTGDVSEVVPVLCVGVSPEFEDDCRLYAGTMGFLHVSSNQGETWTPLGIPEGLACVLDIAVGPGPQAQQSLFGVSASEVFLSTDGGASFDLPHGASMTRASDMSPDLLLDRLYVGDWGGIEIGTNSGEDWNYVLLEVDGEPVAEEVADLVALPGDRVLAITGSHAVFCSDDGGDTGFALCDQGVPELTPQSSSVWGHFRRLATSADHPDTVALAAWQGVYLSHDAGVSWDEACFLRPAYIRGVAFSPGYPDDPRVFVGSYGGGLYVSPDGGESWIVQADSQEYLHLEGLTLAPTFPGDPRMFLVASRRLLASDDAGATWQRVELPGVAALHDVVVSPAFAGDGLVFAVGTAHDEGLWRVDRSLDGGQSWATVFDGEEDGPQIQQLVLSPAADPIQRIYAVQVEPDSVLLSTDAAQSWTLLFQPTEEIAGLWVVPAGEGDDLVLATASGRVWRRLAGGQWQDLAYTGGPVLRGHTLASGAMAVSLDPTGLALSEDGGENWVDLEVPFGSPVLAVATPPDPDDPTLIATTHYGAFFRCNDGASWQLLDRLMRLEDDACDLRYAGAGWQIAENAGTGTGATRSQSAGDTATVGFAGNGIRWLAARGPDRGTATVTVDGVEMITVDLHAGAPSGPEVVFEHDFEAHGWHELRIQVAGDGVIEVDAIDVIRHRVDNGPGESYEIGEWCIELEPPVDDPPPGDDDDGCCAAACDQDRTPASAAVALVLLGVLVGLRRRR